MEEKRQENPAIVKLGVVKSCAYLTN